MFRKIESLLKDCLAAISGSPLQDSTRHQLPALPEDDLVIERLSNEFPRELFARLLLELPAHRKRMLKAHADGDTRQLRDCVHQLLGAAAYCHASDVEQGLRDLRLALKAGDKATIDVYFHQAIAVISRTLDHTGIKV